MMFLPRSDMHGHNDMTRQAVSRSASFRKSDKTFYLFLRFIGYGMAADLPTSGSL